MTKNSLILAAVCSIALYAQSSLTITTPNALPGAIVGQSYAVQLSATGGVTPYTWSFQSGGNPSARFSLSSTGLLSGTPASADLGSITFTVRVTDATGFAVTKQHSVTVQATQPLSLTTTAFTPGVTGVPYSLRLAASGGTAPYRWAVLPAIVTFPVPGQVAPGLTLDSSTGLVTGTPTAAGSFSFTITLTDGANGSVSVPFTLTVTQGGPLTVVTTTMPGGTLGAPYSTPLQARGGIPPYIWSISSGSLPAGLTLDNENDKISGAPLTVGTSQFTLIATDHATPPNTARQTVSIAVVAPPPLTISATTLTNATQGAPYSQKIAASGGVPPYNWTVSSGALPGGLSLNPKEGVLEGTPSVTGSFTFTVQLADSAVGTPARTTMVLGLTVAQLTQVSVASRLLDAGTAGTPYSSVLRASGGAAPYNWTVITGNLPPGLYLNSAGTLSGVPSSPGEFGFTVQVTDASGASAVGAVSVPLAPATLAFLPLTLPSGVVGTPYPPQVLEAVGGTPPYTFAIQGSAPVGLTDNGAVVFAGTPTVSGTSNINVRVTDARQITANTSLQLVVRAAQPADLVLSAGSLSFVVSPGSEDLPAPKNFTIASSSVTTPLSYQISVSPAAPWLSLSGNQSGSTPNGVTVALTAQALQLAASATPYSTVITVTCFGQSPCSASSQTVRVSLLVRSTPAQLSLTTGLLSLALPSAGGQPTGTFGIQNAGGDFITVNSVVPSDPWLTVSDVPAAVAPGAPAYVTVRGNLPSYSAGYRRSTITVNTSAGSAKLPVRLLISAGPVLTLSNAGRQFQMAAGGAVGNPNGTVQLLLTEGSASWAASVLPNTPWLTVKTPTGTAAPTIPGTLEFSIEPTVSAALTAGTYYGKIRITSGQAVNSPLEFVVVLNIAPAGTPPNPELSPNGLVFISNGTGSTASQQLTLFASSVTPVPYQAFASTASGANWLSVSPTVGSASASSPGRPTVSVNPAGLAPGVYRGIVTYQFSPSGVRSVNITYIVPAASGGALPFFRAEGAGATDVANLRPRATCTPTRVVATATGMPSNFSQPAAWPAQLSVLLIDDCGTTLPNGAVDVTFSSGEPPVGLLPDPANAGRYSATWVPRNAVSQVTITAFASAPGLSSARMQISGKVTPNPAPSLTPGGMLNVFNPSVGGGIAPGTAVQIYGANLAPAGVSDLAASLPFPTSLSGTSVLIGGSQAPLYYVSPGQINALAPFELLPGVPYQVMVTVNGAITTPDQFTATVGSPGIAAFANGNIIATHLDNSLVTDASPAKPGEIIVLYLAGLGRAQNQPPTGSGAPLPPTDPLNPVTLTMAGKAVPTLFVGLTPGAVGLYQINFTVPADAAEGSVQLTVVQADVPSNVTILPIRK